MWGASVVEPFLFDVASVRARFEADGWFIAEGACNPVLLDDIESQLRTFVDEGAGELADWRVHGKKAQALWDLPAGLDVEALCAAIAEVTGLDPKRTVIAERHLKVYSASAPERPPAHKDRSASTVTVGIAVDVPAQSRLVLWPSADRVHNPFPTSEEWRGSLDPQDLPERVLDGVAPVELRMGRGDVVAFRGAEIYHERHQPAGAALLYLKFNDVGLDPLGEDPRTPLLEERSRELSAEGLPASGVLEVSPRVVGLRSEEYFPSGPVRVFARLLGRSPGVPLSEADVALVRTSHGDRGLAVAALAPAEIAAAERLVRLGVLVLR